jgi:hypothetical protein
VSDFPELPSTAYRYYFRLFIKTYEEVSGKKATDSMSLNTAIDPKLEGIIRKGATAAALEVMADDSYMWDHESQSWKKL